MKIRYFPDTDTALMEHARETANIAEVAFVQVEKAVA
jgi:uncharacterized protein YuzE